jgi:hypothetical protein
MALWASDLLGEGFFLASLPVAHPSILPTIEINPQIKAISIMELADYRTPADGVLTFDCG